MSEYESPEWHPAFEEYCETIYELGEDDLDVIQARIAERMDVSRPAVSEMMKRLEVDGLIEAGREIKLTEKGMHLAETVVRRHRLAECFLTDVLGLSWADAHQDVGARHFPHGRKGHGCPSQRSDHVPSRQPDSR